MPRHIPRDQAIDSFYSAERRAGASPLVAYERAEEFAKRLDGLDRQREYENDLAIIRQCIERR